MGQVRWWWTKLCAALVAVAVTSACSGDKSRLTPPPVQQPVARKVSGVLLDAATGRLVAKPVKVTIRDGAGALASIARDGDARAITQLSTSTGVFGFAIAEAAALPQKLTLVATADGYFTASADVEILTAGETSAVLRLVSVTAPPVGVVTAQAAAGTADATGVVAAPQALGTAPDPTTGVATTLEIPAGTKVTAADGTPLVGDLTATLSYFAGSATTALAAYPGGLDVTLAPAAPGAAQEAGSFVSGGFAAIELRDPSGKLASQFDKPLEISLSLTPGTVNPATGIAVKAGDTIPFWSYSETTGQWTAEGTLTVLADGNGGLVAIGSVNHLSYFNLDWWQARCANDVRVEIGGNPEARPLTIELVRPGLGYFAEVFTRAGENAAILHNAPASMQMNVKVKYGGQVVGQVTVPNVCTPLITVPVTMPAIQSADLEVSVFSACVQDTGVRSPEGSATVAVGRPGQVPVIGSTGADGKALFRGLPAGYAHVVSVSTLDGATVSVPRLLNAGLNRLDAFLLKQCQVTTGATGGQGR